MDFHSETAAPMGSIIGNGGSVVSKAVRAENYPTRSEISTSEYAAALISTRFRLPLPRARLVCHLSGLGGAA
jgi:hypothetical protein